MIKKFEPNLYDLCKILQAVEDLENHPSLGRCEMHPNYYHVQKMVQFDVKSTINYLRLAENLGFLESYGGFYCKGRGGSKRWVLVRYPNSIEIIRGLDTIRGLTK